MDYELISDADYDTLPADPYRKFVAIEQICRRNMTAMINNDSSGEFDQFIRLQYMTIVSAIAEELGIEGADYHYTADNAYGSYQDFLRRVSGVVARIRLRSPVNDQFSVRLANKTKGIIEYELDKLRTLIHASDLEEARKQRLLGKIEEFRTELHKQRLAYPPAMAALAFLAAGVAGTTSLLADAPAAIATITSLIGSDKEKEDAEVVRLGPTTVPKAIAPPQGAASRADRLLEDDTPF